MFNRFQPIKVAIVICLLAVAACGKKQVTPTATPPVPPPAMPPPAAAAAAPAAPAPEPVRAALTDEELFAQKTLAQLNAESPLSHIFFEVDSAELRPSDLVALQQNSAWLRRWGSTRIVVEGHGDSRGTPEYNLALGDRRAQAVSSYLQSIGVGAERVLVVTKGKDQPFCHDEIESCWQSNRRAHFVISAK